MKRKTAGRSAKPRACALCGGMMSADRPVFLLVDGERRIVGPYHAGCAERVRVEGEKSGQNLIQPGDGVQRFGQIAREETLPW